MINKINELKKTIERQQAMINFQTAQHNIMVDLGIEREKEINRLKSKISGLEDKPIIELDLYPPMIRFVKK